MKFIGSNSRTDHVDVDKGSKTPSSAKNEPADIPASFHCITEGYHLPDQNRVYDWLVASSTGYAAEDRCGLGDRSSLRRILRNSVRYETSLRHLGTCTN
ncbi:unnamed protein product [Aspergillus oryzae]|nr:unnamed protein product [Aspergillus oryzae]